MQKNVFWAFSQILIEDFIPRKTCVSYLFVFENIFFSGNKTLNQHLVSFCLIFHAFFLFYTFHVNNMKKKNFTAIWNAQHSNAGQNMQQETPMNKKVFIF